MSYRWTICVRRGGGVWDVLAQSGDKALPSRDTATDDCDAWFARNAWRNGVDPGAAAVVTHVGRVVFYRETRGDWCDAALSDYEGAVASGRAPPMRPA